MCCNGALEWEELQASLHWITRGYGLATWFYMLCDDLYIQHHDWLCYSICGMLYKFISKFQIQYKLGTCSSSDGWLTGGTKTIVYQHVQLFCGMDVVQMKLHIRRIFDTCINLQNSTAPAAAQFATTFVVACVVFQ